MTYLIQYVIGLTKSTIYDSKISYVQKSHLFENYGL